MIQAVANGVPLPAPVADPDGFVARQAQEHADCSRAEVLELLRQNGSQVAAMLRSLNDEQLQRTARSPRGRLLTIDDAVERGLVGHLRGHFQAILDTLDRVG
jgi:hypothetical protein